LRRQLASDPGAKVAESDLMLALARCGDHEEAARIARRMIEKPPQNAAFYVDSACGLAISAAGVDGDLKRGYTDEAVAGIRRAMDRGWRDLGRLKVDPDLDPIRDDSAFQSLFPELEELIKQGK
jgi:hypothetical protein